MQHPSRPLLPRTLSAGLGLCALALPWLAASSQAQVVFSQDFSSSNTTSDYVGSGPNQFDGILGSGGNVFAVTNGALQVTKTDTSSSAINRITPLPTSGQAASFQFDFSVSNATATTDANDLIFQVGSGFTDVTSSETAKVYQNFNIDLQGGSNFAVVGASNVFTGLQTIILDLNKTASTVNFRTPSGGTLALASNDFAIFVGNTNVILSRFGTDQFGVTGSTAQDITQFKLRYQGPGDLGTVTVDNFVVTVVPEPSTYVLLGLAALGAVIVRRRRSAC